MYSDTMGSDAWRRALIQVSDSCHQFSGPLCFTQICDSPPPSTSLPYLKKILSLNSHDEKERGRGGVKRREGLYIDMNPRRRRLFTQSLPTARSPFTQQPLSLKLPALPPLPTLFDALNPSFLWGKPFTSAATAWMWGCAGVATQSISFTCVESHWPQDAAYRVCVFFSSPFSVTLLLKRDPWASLYMNNPCVFRVGSDERRLFECLPHTAVGWQNKRMFVYQLWDKGRINSWRQARTQWTDWSEWWRLNYYYIWEMKDKTVV